MRKSTEDRQFSANATQEFKSCNAIRICFDFVANFVRCHTHCCRSICVYHCLAYYYYTFYVIFVCARGITFRIVTWWLQSFSVFFVYFTLSAYCCAFLFVTPFAPPSLCSTHTHTDTRKMCRFGTIAIVLMYIFISPPFHFKQIKYYYRCRIYLWHRLTATASTSALYYMHQTLFSFPFSSVPCFFLFPIDVFSVPHLSVFVRRKKQQMFWILWEFHWFQM